MTDRRTVLKALAATPLLLTGCATRYSTTPPGVLNVGQISNSVAFFPLFVAEHQGYFAAEGVQLGERPRLGTGAKVAAALKGGSIDLGAGVITDAFNLAKIDDGTRVVTSLVTEYYVDIVVPPSFEEPDTLENTDAAALDALVPILGQEIPRTPQVERTSYDIARTFHLDSGLVKKAPTYEEVLAGRPAA